MDRPLIGVNMRVQAARVSRERRQVPYPDTLHLSAAYIDCVNEADADAVNLPPSRCDIPVFYSRLDGIIFIGGDDYDPRNQGFALTTWSGRLMQPRREDFDRRLMQYAWDHAIPVLAIGAGMQLMNVVCGGTLSYEIREDFPRANPHHEAGFPVRHGLAYESVKGVLACMFGECLQAGVISTGSQHHQAVDGVAPGFEVTARSEDGIIEAIESIDPAWWAMGVQFHPESPEATRIERMVFETWVNEINNRKQCTARVPACVA